MSTELATQPKTALSVWSLDTTQQKIQALVPSSLSWDRFKRLATSLIQRNPKIAECEPVSLMSCFSDCATIGVYPDPVTGKAYIIPRFNKKKQCLEATLLVGYKGLRDIALRSPDIVDLWTGVVRQGDVFKMVRAPRQELIHEPLPEESGEVIGCYSIAALRNGLTNFEWMPVGALNKIKGDALKGQDDWKVDQSPWTLHENEMNRKTVLRRHFKSLPLRAEDQEAAAKEVDVELSDGDVREIQAEDESKQKRMPPPKRSEKGAAAVIENDEKKPEAEKKPDLAPVEIVSKETAPPAANVTPKTEASATPPASEPAKTETPPKNPAELSGPRTGLKDGESGVFLCKVVECTATAKGNMNAKLEGEFVGEVFHLSGAANKDWKKGLIAKFSLNGKQAKNGIYNMVDKIEALTEDPE